MTFSRMLALALACAIGAAFPADARQYNNGDSTISDGVRIETGSAGTPISSTNPLPTSGQVGGYDNGVPITPTVQTQAYSGSASLGGLQPISVFRTTGQASAILTNFLIGSKGGATTGITVYIFDTNPTASTCTDKTTFSLGSADLAKLAMAPFSITPAASQGTTATTAQQSLSVSVKNQDSTPTQNLYVCLVANGSITPASTSDLVFKLSLSQD